MRNCSSCRYVSRYFTHMIRVRETWIRWSWNIVDITSCVRLFSSSRRHWRSCKWSYNELYMLQNVCSWNKSSNTFVNSDSSSMSYVACRVIVELNWIRARVFNSRFEQDWTYSSRSSESNELRFLFERVTRARTFVRRIESNKHICSSELLELELLFDELNQTDIFVRRALNSNFDSYKNLELSSQIVSWTVDFVRRTELNKQFCSTSWAEQAILFDKLTWVSSFVRARVLN